MSKYLITMEQVDMLERAELRRFAERTEYNKRMRENALLTAALCHERKCRERERRKHRKELNGMTAFICLTVCLALVAACVLSSAPWTVFLAIGCAVAVMWKGGWIG